MGEMLVAAIPGAVGIVAMTGRRVQRRNPSPQRAPDYIQLRQSLRGCVTLPDAPAADPHGNKRAPCEAAQL
jgi:hypothetical protein